MKGGKHSLLCKYGNYDDMMVYKDRRQMVFVQTGGYDCFRTRTVKQNLVNINFDPIHVDNVKD